MDGIFRQMRLQTLGRSVSSDSTSRATYSLVVAIVAEQSTPRLRRVTNAVVLGVAGAVLASCSPAPVAMTSRHTTSTSRQASNRSVPTSTSTTTVPPRTDPFGSLGTNYLTTRTGTVEAAVEDLSTGQTWSLGQGRPQAEASIVKLDVLESLLAQQDHSGNSMTGEYQMLAQNMIEDSDNNAATQLWNAVGGAAGLRAFNASVGLVGTSPSPCIVCTGFPWPGWGLTTTTPTDQVDLLRQVVEPNDFLTLADRTYALQLLENVTPDQRWGVTAGIPAQVTIALKNGWLPLNDADTDWQINSIGWISGLGRNYLIAVLSTGSPTEQYGIETIDQLSASVWAAMG